MKKYLYIIIVALVTMSCVYEFTPDLLVESTKGLVVEGDILIGDISRISISAVEPLTGGTTRTVKGWA